ncbi:MAG: hypothetical protein ABIQ60_09805 [Burkholderiaceae bacterium]
MIVADGDCVEAFVDVVEQGRLTSTIFIAQSAPPGAVACVPRPVESALLLGSLDAVAARRLRGEARSSPPDSTFDDQATRAKAAARTATRHVRLSDAAASAEMRRVEPDVLVLDATDSARAQLCHMLEGFGFCAYPARDVSQASFLLDARRFGAAFLEIALDGSDQGAGVGLCQRIKRLPSGATASATALFVLAGTSHPIDRVRAELIGSDAYLVKPLQRGDVARALESSGVPLPTDSRHC